MKHFQINFGILHDSDPPVKSNGDKNGMWTANDKIRAAINLARQAGVVIRHRVSVPDFERLLGGDEESKDKSINAYQEVVKGGNACTRVQNVLEELANSQQYEPFAAAVLASNPD